MRRPFPKILGWGEGTFTYPIYEETEDEGIEASLEERARFGDYYDPVTRKWCHDSKQEVVKQP